MTNWLGGGERVKEYQGERRDSTAFWPEARWRTKEEQFERLSKSSGLEKSEMMPFIG